MIKPKTICSPPNPPAKNQLNHAGENTNESAPIAMKHTPIMGTTRTENAPAVTMPAPYNISHNPAIGAYDPLWNSAHVTKPPATIGGQKLKKNCRPGAVNKLSSPPRVLR